MVKRKSENYYQECYDCYFKKSGTPEEVMSKIFRVFDQNGDGVITEGEMNKIIKVSQNLETIYLNISPLEIYLA